MPLQVLNDQTWNNLHVYKTLVPEYSSIVSLVPYCGIPFRYKYGNKDFSDLIAHKLEMGKYFMI